MGIRKKKRTIFRHAQSIIAEEYDVIRTNIEFSSYEHNTRSVVISSPQKGEGKSVTAANIAVSFAKQGKKILLIDGHMRNPTVHLFFQFRNCVGLSHILTGQRTAGETTNRTSIEGLHVITAGAIPYNTEELFRSVEMDRFMEQAYKLYDFVIVDGPPVLESPDAKMLAMKCDGVILVLKNNQTEDRAAIEAKNTLTIVKANILGAILNGKNSTAS
ncbi:CpsD/CapB family tyrosine-protein kinase [Halalkalibacter hemicellulosilyticus]|uniref:non-specific protein-tyrosine kinase n=1 Tax=Halalkalibacter hemicellulosilyticusJCM 9152 TaxID=1236971 RepID=W4QDA0_9BACI|nr:CpsD/CapB family tyrosine-protein kinase [Halalkalibacter hemicellulosilyticus]GAE30020.1 capsular polysaccharide biosynthesis protein [Halalkalibacter hemicellulosilyticusJCM 9152]